MDIPSPSINFNFKTERLAIVIGYKMTIVTSFDVGEKNLAYVICHDTNVIDMVHVNVLMNKNQTISDSCEYISKHLSEKAWSNINTILIERQIKANIRALCISQHIWTWFRIKYPDLHVEYVSARLKTNGEKLTYRERKKFTVIETRNRLKDTKFITYLDSLPKQDDVCDAYMQYISWSLKKSK